jgi:UDPglucose--hexose-1-phosphate uridylyltransferase
MTARTMSLTGGSALTRVTRNRLADGRELLFFDRDDPAPRTAADRRELPPRGGASELRWDALQGEWVVIASHRQARTFRPGPGDCPLCPSRGATQTEIPEPGYEVVTFENRFSAFAPEHVVSRPGPQQADPGPRLLRYPDPRRIRPGYGRCEVMVFTDDHAASVSSLPASRIRTIIDAWAHRTSELITLAGIACVYCFENRGDEIGVTLTHPHGQIYGYPFLPPRVEREAAALRRHLIPRRHLGRLDQLDDSEREELASLYPEVLGRFDRLFGQPAPYVAGWEQAPAGPPGAGWHLTASVFTIRRSADKLKYLAGSESGAAVWISDIAPEAAAAALRAKPS